MDERNLIQKAQQGDQDAFADLFKDHRGRIISLAAGILQNEDDAEEVASDVFLKGIKTYKNDKGAIFSTWLHRLAKNVCLERLRRSKAKKRGGKPQGDDKNLTAKPTTFPDHDEAEKESGEAVRYWMKEGGPSQEERDPHRVILARTFFLNAAKRELKKYPDAQVRRHGLRIIDDPRTVELFNLLADEGGRIDENTFLLIVRICADFAERPAEAFTPNEARAALKVLKIIGDRFRGAPSGSGFETMTENIEKILSMLRPPAAIKNKKTALHYDLYNTLGPVIHRLCGHPVRKALVLAAEITYGKKRSLEDVKAARKRR